MGTSMINPKILQIFISYAHEDAKIAIAVSNALHEALGDTLADVFLDRVSLETGFEFKPQIEERLDKTDVLIIIYTGIDKPIYGFTGFELGYFRNTQRREDSNSKIGRRIVPLYLYEGPPSTVAGIQGIPLGINRETLTLTTEEFVNNLVVDSSNPMVKFLDELKEIIEDIRKQGGYPRGNYTDTVKCVRGMFIEIFSYLKTTVDKILKPQKQIIIKTDASSIQAAGGNLPSDAILVPVGSGHPMSIFGLPEEEIKWGVFKSRVSDHRFGDSWRESISNVVVSSLPNQIEIDNSQIIVSSDERYIYRLILTTSTTYFNGNKEFHLYLVEALRSKDYGNKDTTLLLKGLEMVCRFRFLFLESDSEFYHKNIIVVPIELLPKITNLLIDELNLFLRYARETGLDKPNVWSKFVSWDNVIKLNEEWVPREKKIREVAARIIGCYRDNISELETLRREFVSVIEDLEKNIRPYNSLLIKEMLDKLSEIVGIDNGKLLEN